MDSANKRPAAPSMRIDDAILERMELVTPKSVSGHWMSQELWHGIHDAVVFADFESFQCLLNDAAKKLLARLPGNGEPSAKMRNLLKHMAKNESFALEEPFAHEMKYRGFWFSVNIIPVDKLRHLLVFRDISDGKSLAEQLDNLQGINSELNEIIELSADGLVSVDRNGRILRLNRAYKNILGIGDENFIGQPAENLLEKGYLSELVSPHVLKTHKTKNIVVKIRGKDVLLTGRPVFNEDGELARVVANIRDLTKLNELKNKLQKYHELAHRYETEIRHLRAKEIKTKIVGTSPGTLRIISLAEQASRILSTVLIYGETGTGKEVLAKSIHKLSNRKDGPFIAINCSSIPESLIESELLGYEAGAFTGSLKSGKIGLFEAAQGGTIFLDEISDMTLSMQTKLLRVLQDKKIRRVGSNKERAIDIRIIAASNKELKPCIASGEFRADLYYRLNIINIDIPPLRKRKEDIPLLINHFLDIFNRKYHRSKRLTKDQISMMMKYDWPGNIRELENMIERFIVLNYDIPFDDLIFAQTPFSDKENSKSIHCLKSYLFQKEKKVILETHGKHKNTRETAKALNVSQATIVRKLIKYREQKPDNSRDETAFPGEAGDNAAGQPPAVEKARRHQAERGPE